MRNRHGERGQVLPVWAVGIGAMLVLAMMVIRYADIVQWQIRAQNAADSAAQAVLAMQTEQLNELTSTLYAASVEEYRLRFTLYAMGNAAYGNGGCSLDGSCSARYAALYTNYLKSVYRYRAEVELISQISSNLNFGQTQTDAAALLLNMQQPGVCGSNGGLDCKFNYQLVNYNVRSPVYQVNMDAVAFISPSRGFHMTPVTSINPAYQPAIAEVAVCADVPSPVPAFFGFQPGPYRVIARSAATAVMREQDWFQPGSLQNPFKSALGGAAAYYQTVETPSGSASTDGTGFDWYSVRYGGNSATAYAALDGYAFNVYRDDFTKFVGWWSAVPIRPYIGFQNTVQLGCSS